MENAGIERTLAACEDALAQGGRVDLGKLGFWKAVRVVKRTPGAPQRYGERIAAIDRGAFLRRAPIHLPASVGVALEELGTVVGLLLVAFAGDLRSPYEEILLLVGAGILIGATHALTHYVVGGAMGIRFTHFYSLPPKMPQPGFKIDYASYLAAPARSRAWMHASGAIVSKVIPFAIAGWAALNDAQSWAVIALLAIGVLQLVTDVTLSTRASDWKKFRREMRLAG